MVGEKTTQSAKAVAMEGVLEGGIVRTVKVLKAVIVVNVVKTVKLAVVVRAMKLMKAVTMERMKVARVRMVALCWYG